MRSAQPKTELPQAHSDWEMMWGVKVVLGGRADLVDLAQLLWLHAAPEEQTQQSTDAFAVDLAEWWSAHEDSHLPFLARCGEYGAVGMAWLALLPRVPRPGRAARWSGDIQSVFVLPDQRGRGVGGALIKAASQHAFGLGVARVTVQSGRKAAPLYERLGFASSPQLLQSPAG